MLLLLLFPLSSFPIGLFLPLYLVPFRLLLLPTVFVLFVLALTLLVFAAPFVLPRALYHLVFTTTTSLLLLLFFQLSSLPIGLLSIALLLRAGALVAPAPFLRLSLKPAPFLVLLLALPLPLLSLPLLLYRAFPKFTLLFVPFPLRPSFLLFVMVLPLPRLLVAFPVPILASPFVVPSVPLCLGFLLPPLLVLLILQGFPVAVVLCFPVPVIAALRSALPMLFPL